MNDSRWGARELGDLLTLQRGFDLPYHARKPGRVPVISSSGRSGNHCEAKCRAPGIVTGRYGTLGEVHWITEDYWPHNTALYVKDMKGNDPRFLYYLLWHTNLAHHNDKSGVPGVNRNDLHRIEVMRPPLPQQRAIAQVLGGLDDKIALNLRMNGALEELARRLFCDWLDRLSERTETVVTKTLIDNGTLVIGDGYRAKRAELRPTGLPFARAGNIDGGFQFKDCEYLGADGVIAAGEKVSRPMDSVFTSKGTVGRLALVTTVTPQFVYAPQLCYWRVTGPSRLNPYVLHQWMHEEEFGDQVEMTKGQTDMADYVSLTDQRRMLMTLPPPDKQAELGCHLQRIYDQITANTTQTHLLAALRDSLLPQLLSGEIRLADAEKRGETAV